jgi:hypothetical protein
LQTPIRRRALAFHSGVARVYRVFGSQEAELVLVANAAIVVLGAGLAWLQFETPLRTLLAAAGAAYVVLFLMLLRTDTATAVGAIGGLIVASWSGILAAALVARWSLVAACCFGTFIAVQAFIFTWRTYRSFSDVLRKFSKIR